MSDGPFLSATGLRRTFGERVALDGLSFEVARGEVLGFLGPNGAGKSTTFRILAGLIAPDAGEIRLEGRVVSTADRGYRARLGCVFQSPAVDDLLTGRENLHVAALLYGLSGARARARIDEALDLLDLRDRAGERAGTWSGGLRRRLEIARALLPDPDLLVLDEPGAGLDPQLLRRVWTHLRETARARGRAVLLTTHAAEEADFCDRVAFLHQGRLVACDAPAGLRARLGGDVVTVDPADGDTAAVAAAIAGRFGVQARVVDGAVVVEQPRGHEWIPRLVESLPPGALRSVGMHPPSLADVFAKLTGRPLA